MVAEADESDRSFLMLWPSIAVMTNIDHEHMESYGSFAELQQAFADFANKVPFYGSVVACADDPNLAAVLPRVTRRLVTYGLDTRRRTSCGSRRRARRVRRALRRSHRRRRDTARSARACSSSRCPDGTTCRTRWRRWPSAMQHRRALRRRSPSALAAFEGAERRFERHGEAGGVLVVDDYAHHPTEIAAVLAAARAVAWPPAGRRVSAAPLHADAAT